MAGLHACEVVAGKRQAASVNVSGAEARPGGEQDDGGFLVAAYAGGFTDAAQITVVTHYEGKGTPGFLGEGGGGGVSFPFGLVVYLAFFLLLIWLSCCLCLHVSWIMLPLARNLVCVTPGGTKLCSNFKITIFMQFFLINLGLKNTKL